MRRVTAAVGLALVAAVSPLGWALGEPEGLERANRLYAAGDYAGSVEVLERLIGDAVLDRADTALAQYNRGNALYRAGRFADARAAYELAALGSRVVAVEGKATYNIGNCLFREAEAMVAQGDLEGAARSLESALAAYRRALELAPSSPDAATNLEVTRKVLKGVRDELAKYEDIRRLQREIVEELKALIQGETRILQSNESPTALAADVKAAQASLRTRTQRLLGRYDTLLAAQARLTGASPAGNLYVQSRRHVVLSEAYQAQALTALDGADRFAASGPVSASRTELERALEILTPPQGQDERESSGGARDGEGQQEPQGGDTSADQPRGDSGGAGAPGLDSATPDAGGGPVERPEDVLREEGERRRAREGSPQSVGDVDRDW